MRKLLLVLGVFALFGGAYGAVTFDTDTLVQDGDYYDYADLDPSPAATATLTMTGGRIDNLSTWMQSITNMSGGSVGEMFMYQGSVANISGDAEVERLETYSDSDTVFSTAHITGGAVDWLDCYGSSQVHLYGLSFEYTSWNPSLPTNTGLLTGHWGDGDALSIYLWNDAATWDNIFLHIVDEPQVIPAPGAVLLAAIGLGSFAMFRRRLSL